MSEIEVASLETNQSDNNQEENSDFVDWINSFALEENFYLNYPFDNWQLICAFIWIIIFITCGVVIIFLSRK